MKTARALRLIRGLRAAEAEVSGWEGEFLSSVETRLDTYGRAFADPEKGGRDEALSTLQRRKLKEIKAKVAGDPQPAEPARRSGFKRRSPFGTGRRSERDGGGEG